MVEREMTLHLFVNNFIAKTHSEMPQKHTIGLARLKNKL
jgi:hypothetical protein